MVRAPKVTKPRKLKKKVETYEDFEYEDLCTYAGIDTNVTLDLLKALFPYLTHRPEYRDFIEGAEISTRAPDILTELIEVKTLGLEFTCDLKVTGMFYDQEANAIMRQQMVEDMKETKERIDEYAGMDVPMSGGAFYNYLYRVRKYKSVVKTKNGDDATSGDALKALTKEYPDDKDFLLDLKRFVDVRSMFNGFVDGYIEKFVKYDSRIHCDYLLHGTSSHRMSSQNPNMLNMPRGFDAKDGRLTYNIRNNYTATPGYTLLAFDFSS